MQIEIIRNTERVDAQAWLVMVTDNGRHWLEESFTTKQQARAYARDMESQEK